MNILSLLREPVTVPLSNSELNNLTHASHFSAVQNFDGNRCFCLSTTTFLLPGAKESQYHLCGDLCPSLLAIAIAFKYLSRPTPRERKRRSMSALEYKSTCETPLRSQPRCSSRIQAGQRPLPAPYFLQLSRSNAIPHNFKTRRRGALNPELRKKTVVGVRRH